MEKIKIKNIVLSVFISITILSKLYGQCDTTHKIVYLLPDSLSKYISLELKTQVGMYPKTAISDYYLEYRHSERGGVQYWLQYITDSYLKKMCVLTNRVVQIEGNCIPLCFEYDYDATIFHTVLPSNDSPYKYGRREYMGAIAIFTYYGHSQKIEIFKQ